MLSKKKSRSISVENRNYRWAVLPDRDQVMFVAESADVAGGQIDVYLTPEVTIVGVDFPDLDRTNQKTVGPKDAEKIIRQAIKLGWRPTEKGKALVFDYDGGRIAARSVS